MTSPSRDRPDGGQDRYALWDAAYLLGALSPDDRAAYAAHVQSCPACAAAVQDLAGLPGLLARVPAWAVQELPDTEPDNPGPGVPDDSAPAIAVPDTLLPAVLRQVRRHRRRRRAVVGAVLATAACLLVVISLAVGVRLGPSASPSASAPGPGTALPLTPVAQSPLRASATLQAVPWGTRIVLRCTYADEGWAADRRAPAGGAQLAYALVVADATGRWEQVATWNAVPGRETTLTAATAVPVADISTVEIRTRAGRPVLRGDTAGG